MPHIIDADSPNYIAYRKIFHPKGAGMYNGAYYYSQEIVKNIIPYVNTDRPWDTLGMKHMHSADHAIVFIHHNINHDKVYSWLRRYRDLVYVCSSEASYNWAKQQLNGRAIFLPLSVDVEYVSQFKTEKPKEVCYAGNRWAFKKNDLEAYLPDNVELPAKNLPREELLKFVAPFKICYAIGRSAIEAQVLDCEVRNCDSRYDGVKWDILDNKDAAKILQRELDKIDK